MSDINCEEQIEKRPKYAGWTKLPLNKEQTEFLYECLPDAKVKPLLKAFDGGLFLVKGEEHYLNKTGDLRSYGTHNNNNMKSKVNLSVMNSDKTTIFRIFITYKYEYKSSWTGRKMLPTLTSGKFIIEISGRDKILKEYITIPSGTTNEQAYVEKEGLLVIIQDVPSFDPLTGRHYTDKVTRYLKLRELTPDDPIIANWEKFVALFPSST